MNAIDLRVKDYWAGRAHDFSTVRKNELLDPISRRWIAELSRYFSLNIPQNILDAGTGTGYFPMILASYGHQLTGIDITPNMLEEARQTAREFQVQAEFLLMDAQETSFPDNSFDVILTRNLTWTLPDPEKAYADWLRILKPGGVLLNFDANYGDNVRNQNQSYSYIDPSDIYGHIGVTKEQERANAEITLAMPCSSFSRPEWDCQVLKQLGYTDIMTDLNLGSRVLQEHDLPDAPMFLICAKKEAKQS